MSLCSEKVKTQTQNKPGRLVHFGCVHLKLSVQFANY